MAAMGAELREVLAAYETGALPPEAYVRTLYALLLHREVDQPSLDHYLTLPSLAGLAGGIIESAEFACQWHSKGAARDLNQGAKRVLLFGAYGNGNLGDKIQPGILAEMIRQVRPDLEIWACSALVGRYDFPFDRVLPPEAIHDTDLVNRFDLLIIGGGGLLAHPHDPLMSAEWQALLTLPYALLGIGARPSLAERSAALIRNAARVSGRDADSVGALSTFRDDVALVADPVLCDGRLRRAGSDATKIGSVLWILEQALIEQCRPLLDQIDSDRDTICFLEPQLDAALLLRWPDAIAIYDLDQAVGLIDAADAVVSMRYHGMILSFLRGRPVHGIAKDKSAALADRYDMPQAFSADGGSLTRSPAAFGEARLDRLVADQAALVAELGAILSVID